MNAGVTITFARRYLAWLGGQGRSPRRARLRDWAEHEVRVEGLCRQVVEGPPPFRLVKRGPGHQARPLAESQGTALDVGGLDAVLEVDGETRTATVEPQVTIRELVQTTGRHGLAPAVVPEFPDITVGGAIAGLAAESGSHRHGLFHESLEWLDVVLGSGERLRVSDAEHRELWAALPGAYGTLGLVVAARLRLVERRPWVRLEHRRFGLGEIVERAEPWPHDFVDALCDRGEEVVLTTGDLVDDLHPGEPVWRPRSCSEYYCDHLVAVARNGGAETMAYEDYVFRYDRGAFWIGPSKLGRSFASRLVFGGFATASNLYLLRRDKQRLSPGPSRRLVQDCIVPAGRGLELVRFVRRATAGPLWLLPIESHSATLFGLAPGRWLNVGIYVRLDATPEQALAFNRQLETEVHRLGGVKTLHAEVFAGAAELAEVYDLAAYDALRRSVGAEGVFPHLLAKLRVEGFDGC